jgi:hypothetical protein
MPQSLHGNKGGRKSTSTHVPSESEAFALVTGCAMHWALRRSSDNPAFFKLVAEEVERTEATLQDWSHDEMKILFHDKMLNGIGQKGFKTHLQRDYGRKDVDHEVWARNVVESVMYRFLATADGGSDHVEAMKLAHKAKLDEVLQLKRLSGYPSWKAEDFINAEVWTACGEQAGLQSVSIKFLTLIACGARTPPLNPICPDCNELRCVHKGDRLNVSMISCKCDTVDVDADGASKRKASPATAPKAKASNSFEAELDPTGHGTCETFDRKVMA